MPAPVLRSKPPTQQWTPSHRLGAGLTFACIFTTSGSTHRNIAARGVSDVTLINASMTGGAYGYTAQFGTGTYAKATRSPATQPTGGYTVAALVRSNGAPGGALPIMVCASIAPYDATWYLGVGGGVPRFARRGVGNGYQAALPGSFTWGNDYHLFAGTTVPSNATDTAGSVLLYADGARLASALYTEAQAAYTADPLLIGSLYDSTSNSETAWPGDIAAVYIWRRPLSDAEHAALAADPFAPVRPRSRPWFAVAVPITGTLGATADAASVSLGATISLAGTLGATAQAASTSLTLRTSLAGTLGAAAQSATTSLAETTAIPATLGAQSQAASMSLTTAPIVVATFTVVATVATVAFGAGQLLRFLDWDAVADADITDPFEIDPDATRDDAY